ncbi:hypothetical protein CLOM_g3919 [Closterium sp. NIES-68]|nr:hypothetical protein CLOM_g3919 [Closterium sp. NIES-68]
MSSDGNPASGGNGVSGQSPQDSMRTPAQTPQGSMRTPEQTPLTPRDSGRSSSPQLHLTPRASAGSPYSSQQPTFRSTPSFPRSDLGGSMAQRRRFHRRRQGASGQAASGGGVPSGTPVSTPGPPEPSDSMGGNSEQDRMSWEQYQQQQQHRQPQRGRGGAAAATAAGAAGAGGAGRAGAGGDALGGEAEAMGEEGEEELEGTYVWGTGVSVQDVSSKFASFVQHFREADDAIHAKYSQQLDELVEMEGDTFPVDCADVYAFSAELYRMLVRYPLEVIPIFDIKIAELAADRMPMWDKHIQVRTFNLRDTVHMRDLNPSDIDALVAVRGMVIRTSSIIPDIKAAYFKCLVCGHSPDLVLVDRGVIEEPRRCPWPECGALNSMTLVHNRSRFINKQMLRLQETPEDMPEGETPHTVSVFLFDSLVDTAKPGDRVEVTGVFRAVPVRVNSNQRNLRSLYRTYLDCIHIRKEEGGRTRTKGAAQQSQPQPLAASAAGDADDANPDAAYFSPQQVEAFRELSRQPDIYEKLARSLAPSIYELDDIKKGLLCQLFGGSVKRLSSGVQFRGDMNVLLVGDPGTSKSQLLQYVHKIAPRGIYTSGRGSSAVGLTAYVTKDPETREMVLESGALVLSDRGICCIDEFDKMSDNARSMLHEVMEQQTVSVAKAGIIATLNARTSVLACANPAGSRYNPRLSVIDNIQLPPTLLSRFDLIYLVLDKAEEQSDRRLARHLVALHYKNPEASAAATIDVATLTSYITYARTRIHPELSDEAAEELVNAYVELRGRGSGRKVITATPRQLESLIRISEALARLKLASTVTHEDVTEARRLLDVAMQQSATDPNTGTIDMDLITTGVSASERAKRMQLQEALLSFLQDRATASRSSFRAPQVWEDLRQQSSVPVTLFEVREALGRLHGEGKVVFIDDTVRVS